VGAVKAYNARVKINLAKNGTLGVFNAAQGRKGRHVRFKAETWGSRRCRARKNDMIKDPSTPTKRISLENPTVFLMGERVGGVIHGKRIRTIMDL